ncbi:endo-1,4-beta-xylanase [Yeosuana aromativorans]|uniref:Endo-1,4-beta-xylanase n=1 Tax=Yeosuana aromativorans TaxID=288019 RepID=A0A8J3FKM8_9FLAO|nr:alpha/beta hydrolase-fold protein [Yeosuana aromativorans]GGK34074.1 endo-1,4-beta-xylanase [Yeosuana aromativorans]
MAVIRIEISDPNYEVENLRYLTVQSSYLGGRGDATVFVPPNTDRLTGLPLVILLHGVYASHWAWTRHMDVHNRLANQISKGLLPPMVLVMPSDGLWSSGSAYLPHSGKDFEKWIAVDVLEAVLTKIPQVNEESKKFISGLSMGGYGALRIGIKYGDVFNAFSGHSSITNLDQMSLFVEDDLGVFNPESKDEYILNYIIENKGILSPFRFDCGTEDILIEHNRMLHNQLESIKVPHIYEEFEGGHTSSYWQEHIMSSLQFFATFLNKFKE